MNRDDRITAAATLIGFLVAITIEVSILMTHTQFLKMLSRLDQVAVGAGIPAIIGCVAIIIVGTILDKRWKKE